MIVIVVLAVVAFLCSMAAVYFYIQYSNVRDALSSRVSELERDNASLSARLESGEELSGRLQQLHRETLDNMKVQHQKDMELMRDQFKAAASEIASKNTQEFKEQSAGKIADLLNPIKEKFIEFSRSVDESKTTSVRMKTSIEEQIKNLMDQSGKVSEEARNLANALTSRSKVQGDFGELILKDILLNAGLTEGIHFVCQGVMTDENGHEVKSDDGRTLIPDVLVFYPDDTMVVVDSKVSLTAYALMTSAVSDEERDSYARQHIESVRKHINELAAKNYASYVPSGKRKVDYNIMFIPNEGAFQAMLERAPSLWQESKNRNVLIVSQMTLVIVLNMIQMVWKQSVWEKNIEEVHKTASELMTQLQSWLSSYTAVGEQLERALGTYNESKRRLSGSNQSVLQKIRKLEKQGASPKRTSIRNVSRKSGPESIIPPSLMPDTE